VGELRESAECWSTVQGGRVQSVGLQCRVGECRVLEYSAEWESAYFGSTEQSESVQSVGVQSRVQCSAVQSGLQRRL
jgi:hypothetical protein